jgi:hypothetical protein
MDWRYQREVLVLTEEKTLEGAESIAGDMIVRPGYRMARPGLSTGDDVAKRNARYWVTQVR